MICKTIDLDIDYAAAGLDGTAKATLETCVITPEREMPYADKRPAVIVIPGGAYAGTSAREAGPIARQYSAAGYQTFILWYSNKVLPFPCHLLQAAKAVATVRENAAQWCVDPDKIFVNGFSAGGHLAASIGTLWNREYIKKALGFYHEEHRPNGMILGYPVITAGEFAHRDSFKNLLLDRYSDELLEENSLEKQVSADTVPTFLWHTYTDGCVPVENALLFALALRQKRIPLEMHIFPKGQHGLALSNAQTGGGPAECEDWIQIAIRWIRDFDTNCR